MRKMMAVVECLYSFLLLALKTVDERLSDEEG